MGKKRLRMETPADVRKLIKQWLREISETGKPPFEGGGVVVQLLNVWLKAFELEKLSDVEKRLAALETAKANEERRR